MSALFLKLLNMSISAGWLVLAVLALRFLLKKAPKWVSVLLWGFVAVRLICPISFESVLSLMPSAETVSPGIMMDPDPQIHTGIQALNSVVNPIITESFKPAPMTSMNPLQLWIPLASILWAVGFAGMLIYTAISYTLLRRRVGTAVLLRKGIYQSEYVDSPFVLGVLKPRIYLPFRMEEGSIDYVLAHEQAHIRRKDHWWKPLGFLLLAVYWFNPLMWLGYILLCRDIELACDEKVIKEMDSQNRADYTLALVKCSVNRRRIAACPLAFGEVGIKARVKSVMNYKKPAFWIILAAFISCVAVAVCFLTNPKTAEPEGDISQPAPVSAGAYAVEEVTFESGVYSFTVQAGVNTPIYAITEQMHLLSQKEHSEDGQWTDLGVLEETQLTAETFDSLFLEPGTWAQGKNAQALRENTAKAWQLIYSGNICYYLLQQSDGELYVSFGYTGSAHYGIRWLFKIKADPNVPTGMVATSGDETVPVVAFPAGTAIEDCVDSVFWLTVNRYPDSLVPFNVRENGTERFGFYSAYDAETFEALEFFRPSGLSPQTYIFQNADLTHSYIVTVRFSMEADAPFYAFGAKFDLSQDHPVETVYGRMKTYYKNANGTWSLDGRTYQYRLEITGRMHSAAVDSTFVYLSNLETITFEQAWKAAGYSSNTADYFDPEDAVLVDVFAGGASSGGSTETYQKLTLEDVVVLSQKGYDLKISDFERFDYTPTGSGLYIRKYDLDGQFGFMIGSTAAEDEPLYFYLYLMADPEQRIDIREGGVAAFLEDHGITAPLENAITEAILERNSGNRYPDKPDGLICTEAHYIFGLETKSGTPLAGQTNHMEETTVYLQYVYHRYSCSQAEMNRVAANATPAVLIFTYDPESGYTLKSFREPNGGENYAQELRNVFPEELADKILDPGYEAVDVQQLEDVCHQKAWEYVKGR